MFDPTTALGGLSPETFLERHWQKRALYVRGALPGLVPPFGPEELAGLATEEGVESRIVLEQGGIHPWELRHGPFGEESFRDLPESHWTLLVHELDRCSPAAAELLELFRFIPNWRIDDVMASYAVEAGSVGPHVDQYDVFLIQAMGRRRWLVERDPSPPDAPKLEADVDVLAEFAADDEWIAAPGDLLYLPPGRAHHGVALEPAITLSIGFRAPSRIDLAAGFLTHLVERLDPGAHYDDPDLELQADPGELSLASVRKVRGILTGLVEDDTILGDWLGRFLTEPRRELESRPPKERVEVEVLLEQLSGGATLERSAVPCFAHLRHADGGATLFVGGEAYPVGAARASLASLLTGRLRLDRESLAQAFTDREFAELVTRLVNRGFLLPNGSDRRIF